MKCHFLLTNDWIDESKILGQGVLQGVNRSTVVDKFTVPSLTIGPFELEDVSITTPAEGEKRYIGLYVKEVATRSRIAKAAQTKGIVGYELLKHFLVTVDYSGEKLHLFVP